MQAKDFDIIYSPLCEQIFQALEFRPPGTGEWMWRIPGYFTINDLDTLLDKFKLSMENGVLENETQHELIPFQEKFTQPLDNHEEPIDEVSFHNENEENINYEENDMNSPKSVNTNENKNKIDDEEENYFDVENDSIKKNEKKVDPTPTLPLATFEDLNAEENESKNESKKKDWVDHTLVVPTLNPE